MTKMNSAKICSRLRLSASVMVSAAALTLGGMANAQTVPLTSANSPFQLDAHVGNTVEITNGTNAAIIPGGQEWLLGAGNPLDGYLGINYGSNNLTIGTSPLGGTTSAGIIVDSGATLYIVGSEINNMSPWLGMNNMIQASGNVIFGGTIGGWGSNSDNIIGNNSFLGNVTLLNNAQVWMGETWGAASQIAFGPNTNIYLQGASSLYLNMPSTYTSTVGGIVAAQSGSSFTLASGKLVINGVNTTVNPFAGTFTLGTGAQLMVGDATHSGAVFGDPNHKDGTGLSIALTTVNGNAAVLSGYGTVYAAVSNSGIVKPGGTSGTLGTLTVSTYVQSSTGALQVEVAPTGASKLNVLGSAKLDGSLVIKLDSGTYGNSVFPILSAGSITGSFSTVSTSGSVSGAIVALQTTSSGYNIVTEKASSSQVVGHLVTANRNDIYAFTSSLYDVISGGTPGGAVSAGSRGKVTAWLTPTGRLDNVGRGGLGYGLSSFGISGGVQYDADWKNAVIGLAVAYDHASLDVKNEDTKAHSNTVNVAVYGGADVLYARLDGVVFYNTYDAVTKRTLASYGTAVGSPSGWGWGGSIQVSRSLFHDRVVPFVRGTFARVAQDGLSESGVTTFDLAYNKIDANTFVGDLGFKVNVLPATSKIKLQGTVALRHDFSDPGETIKGSFASLSGSTFNYHWKGDAQNTLLIGANAADEILDNVQVFARVGGEFSQYRRSVNFGVGAKYRF